MTYGDFLNKLAQERQGAPGKPQITYVRSDKTGQNIGQNAGQNAGQDVAKPEINTAQPYADTMEQWRMGWQNGHWDTYMPPENLGPNGEETPYGAKGWDYYGNAWYGDGFQGFWNELKSKIMAPFTQESEDEAISFRTMKEIEESATSLGASIAVPGGVSEEQKTQLKEGVEEKEGLDIGETVENIKEGAAGEPLAAVSRITSAGVEVILDVFDVGWKKTEQALSVVSEIKETAEQTDLPGSEDLPDWLRRTIETIPMTAAANMAWNDVRFTLAPGDMKEKWNQLEASYQAGRVLYTSVFDDTVKEEYLRRYHAGENPYLLQQQLENPLIETAVGLVLDPLNLIGVGTRAARDFNRINDAIDMFAKVAPEVSDFIKSSDALDDIKAAENFKEVVKIVSGHTDKVKTGVTKLATERKLWTLTADGARWETSRITHEVLNSIAAATKDSPDEAMEIVRALMNVASGDEDKVADGLSAIMGATRTVKKMTPETLLSEAAMRTGAVLGNMVGDEEKADDFIKAIGEARKLDTDKFIEWAAKRMDGAIKEMFPTVTERMKLASDIASGKIANPTNYQKIISEVSPAMQSLAKFDDFLQSGKFGVRAINGFFANVYLGLSPSYAARNAMQNYLQMMIDEGPGVFRGASHAVEDINDWLGGVVPEGVKGFSSAAAATTKRFGMTKVSERIEKGAATMMVRHSVEQTMRRMLQPGKALPDVAPLVDAGLSPEAADSLWRMVVNNKGNVGKAVKEFTDKASTGSIDVMETLGWLADKDAKGLQDLKISDGVLQTIRDGRTAGKTVDEVVADVKAFFDENIFKVADSVVDDPQVVSRNLPEFETLAKAASEMGGEEAQTMGNLYQATREAFYTGRLALDNIFRGGVEQLERTGDANLIKGLEGLYSKYGDIANGNREAQITSDINIWSDKRIDWKSSFEAVIKDKTFRNPEYFAIKWKELGMTSEPPKQIGEFFNRFWNEFYYPTKNNMYAAYRNELVAAIEDVGKTIGKNTAEMDAAVRYAKQADAYQQTFDVWRQGRIRTQGFLDKGNIPDAIRSMASQYGISTAPKADEITGKTGAVIKDEVLLNIINKHSGKKYKALQEVDPEIARKAFADNLTKNAGTTKKMVAKEPTEEIGHNVQQMIEQGSRLSPEDRALLRHPMQDLLDKAESMSLEDRINLYASVDRSQLDYQLSEYLKDMAQKRIDAGAAGEELEILEAIVKGKGNDFGKKYFNVKKEMLQDLAKTDETLLAGEIEEAAETVTTAAKNIPAYSGDMAPSQARVFHESRQGITDLLARVEQQLRDNYGDVIPVIGGENTTAAVAKWAEEASRKVNEARLIAANVANAARDFTLLPYGKKYGFDLVLNYTQPYQFWYSRTYANYVKRIAQTPDVIAAYAKYKETLAKIHAGAPDWWKYQINTNELLGQDSDNPLFFNLEATLNPLNGLTGVDFNDSNKRVNWWTSMLDDMGKFGPSIWTPLNWATAAVLYQQGQKDAAERWGSRIFPQTSTIKALLYLGNIKTGVPYNELDPMVQFMSGGIDPYERRRVGRALGWMVEQGEITQAQMVEAANAQSGEIWEEAVARAVKARAPGQISSFFLGVGFKGRSVSDMTIDKFYNEYGKLWDMSDSLSPEELRRGLDELRSEYPFMDGLLLSSKSGLNRDRSYAYSVLSRIPPGQKSEIAEAAGISSELMDKFYSSKGNLTGWGKTDYNKFMAAMVDIGAVLEMPDDATRAEWTDASIAYNKMMSKGKEIFGDDIWDRLDLYYNFHFSEDYLDQQKADSMLNYDPELQEALNWKTNAIMENTDLYAYYGGINTVESYYKGVMYTDLEQRFGKDIFDLQDEYYSLYDSKERKQFLKDHPQLGKMWDAKRGWDGKIEKYIAATANMLREGVSARFQENVEPGTTGQQAVMEAAQPEQKYSWQDYQQILGGSLSNLVLDNIMGGDELSGAAESQLEYIAEQMGISVERLMAMMEMSLNR